MRAIAVLTVFANHLFDWPPGGFVGVDVFFVLSGFFITGILIQERTTRRKLSFQNFAAGALLVVLEALMMELLVTVLASYVLFPATRAKETLLDALYAAVFAANFRFEAVGADYFHRDQPPSPLQHYWSLSIEEQFYFVWPALLVLIFLVTRRLRRGTKTWTRQWGLLGAMGVIVVASFGWAMFLSADDPNRAYFSSLTRVWELGVGASVAIAGPWLVAIPSSARPVLAYVGLTGVVASLFLIDPTVQFPAPWAALPVLSTALVVASFHGAEVRGMFPLTNPVARYLGDTSYTLYLWHWPVVILLLSVFPRGTLYYTAVLTAAFGLTAVTYRYYEDPIRKSGWLSETPSNRRRAIPTLKPSEWGVAGLIGAAVVVTSIIGIGYADARANVQQQIAAATNGQLQDVDLTPEAERNPCFGAPAMVNPNCALRSSDVPLQPSLDRFSDDLPAEAGACYTLSYASEVLSCTFGYMGEDATRIALVGDSHATLLLPALRQILTANKWQLTTFTGHECAFIDPAPAGCRDMMAGTEAELRAHPYQLVIFANYNYDQNPAGYQSAWARITATGNRVAVVADNPESSEEAIACLTRVSLGGDRTGDCATSREQALPDPDPLVVAAQSTPGATVIDLTQYYCTAEVCPSVIGDVIVYRDTNHITATFSKTLAEPLQGGIRRALGS